MSAQLPDLANPWRLVQHQGEFSGQLDAKAFARLNAATLGVLGDIEYRLGFGRDVEGRAVVLGSLGCRVRLECRRCQGHFAHDLDTDFALLLVATEAEADTLTEETDAEVLILADAPARLQDILEDEALLALPPFPSHGPDGCSQELQQRLIQLAPQPEAKNPFAILASLKK